MGRTGPPRPLADRFWEKVRKSDGCWEWTGHTDRKGYGAIFISINNGRDTAHRTSWRLHFGEIPAGLLVCHRCDNPPCVNPAHLFLGTPADNTADMMRKGRMGPRISLAGEKSPSARLTDADVIEIRRLRRAGVRAVLIAERFGVSADNVWLIASGKAWRHLPLEPADGCA